MHIPISRSNGITAALVAPAGGLISGMSCLIKLDGWTNRDMVLRTPAAMHIELASLRAGRGDFMGRGGFGQARVDTPKALEELKALFSAARFYEKRRLLAAKTTLLPRPGVDETAEALLPVLRGEVPVMISVHAEKDIRLAIDFVKAEGLKAVFFGVEQGFKAAADLAQSGIPAVMGSLYDMPPVYEDGYDALFRNPGELNRAGVKIAFASVSSATAKDLPYHAAKAAAFGLDRREALKAVTINPAEIFGLGAEMGSLEKGKRANIVLADADLLELRANIKRVFIDGRDTDLRNRYTELLDTFKKRETEEK
jgi:imidazolonepropionase-like amidohydrolase